MKIRHGSPVLLCLAIALAGSAAAQPEKKPDQPPSSPPPAPDEVMVADAPGALHERLMKLAGAYTTTSKFVMPGAEAMETKGESTFRAAMGGRFLMQDEKGEEFGQPFESFKMYGYNTQARKYEAVWSYTGSTALMTMTGSSADAGKTIVFSAHVDIGVPEPMDFTITMKEISGESFSVTLDAKGPDGEAGPRLETTYTRKK